MSFADRGGGTANCFFCTLQKIGERLGALFWWSCLMAEIRVSSLIPVAIENRILGGSRLTVNY
jgi:hypothetical protein